jgi:sialate O-acetylesterase
MLRLAALFSAHMVVQSGQTLPIWGWADPGDKITVSLAGEAGEAVAGQDGRWQAMLKPLKAGGPYTLLVQGKESLKVEDVLAGEVWLCSGQSNMAFDLNQSDHFKEDGPSFNDPQVRLFSVPNRAEEAPLTDLKSQWRVQTPEESRGFSAVALYFAKQLRQELKVPVGLVASHWGGTMIESWTSPEALQADADNAPYFKWAKKIKPTLVSGPFQFEVRNVRWSGKKPETLDLKQPQLWVDAVSEGKAEGLGVSGRLGVGGWVSLRQDLKHDGKALDARAFDGLEFEAKGTGRLNVIFNQASQGDWGFHISPDLSLGADWKTYKVPFNDFLVPWGGTWPPPAEALESVSFTKGDLGFPTQPSELYNGMIAPLRPLAMRGVCWYQGESNAQRPGHYAKQLPIMIQDWRQQFANPDLGFLAVQIAGYGAPQDQPGEVEWANLREAQLKVLSLPRTGLAVAIDVGDEKDIHPKNKREVGRRLALQALQKIYGKKIVASGPLFQKLELKAGQAKVTFDLDGSKLASKKPGEALKGFALAGADKHFVWANAKIEGNSVILTAPGIEHAEAVRYAWAGHPDCDLVNSEGLPAVPFRTDTWPIADKVWE